MTNKEVLKQKLKNKKHSKAIKSIAFILVFAILISSAYAFLTAHETKTNVFTLGSIKLELHEDGWESNQSLTDIIKDGTKYKDGRDYISRSKLENIVPDEPITKDPTILNVGSNPADVYISVDMCTALVNGEYVDIFDTNYNAETSNWTLYKTEDGDNGRHIYYYSYKDTLYPTEETDTLFSTVTLKSELYDLLDLSTDYTIVVNGFGIQEGVEDTTPVPFPLPQKLFVSYLREDGSLYAREKKEPGDPIEMKFDDSLVKQNFSFDWVTDEGDIAYEGMTMPARNLDLNANYTQLTNQAPSVGYFIYNVCRDEDTNELYAIIYYIDADKFDNSEIVNPPVSISFTCNGKNNTVTDNQEKIRFSEVRSALNYQAFGNDAYDTLIPGERYENIPVKITGEFWKDFPSIKEVYLSDGITDIIEIYGRAGSDDHTEMIHIPYSVTNLYDVFDSTTNLTELIIPNSCTDVVDILGDGRAERVVVPKSVKNFTINSTASGDELVLNNDLKSCVLGCFNKYYINGSVNPGVGSGINVWYVDPDFLDIDNLPEYVEIYLNGTYNNLEQASSDHQFSIGVYSSPPITWPNIHLTINGTINKLRLESPSTQIYGTGTINDLRLRCRLGTSVPKETVYNEYLGNFEGTVDHWSVMYY